MNSDGVRVERRAARAEYTYDEGTEFEHRRPIVEFSVSCRSFTMASWSPTVERALEFNGIYSRLQRDLVEYLEWSWL